MDKKIYVTKYDGLKQLYDQEKVLSSIIRSGVKKDDVLKILTRVEEKLYDGISTAQLYQFVSQEINCYGLPQHSRFYRLREALAKMGSFDFEKFVKKILEKEVYSCQWDVVGQGFCIGHQIDIVAKKKNGQLCFVEVKHHRNFHRNCGLGTMAELWARLEDLQKGYQTGKSKDNFSEAWLVTNSKFSEHAKKYARCKGLKLTGWRYTFDSGGKTEGMEKMIEKLNLVEIDKLIKKVVN